MAEEPTTVKQQMTPSLQQTSNRSSMPSSLVENTAAVRLHSNTSAPIPPPSVVSASGVEDFKCNICLNVASDAVLTFCGHLFCWPCLYTWLHFHSRYKECPVCKGAASETRLIPVYSWGTCKDAAISTKLPNDTSIPPRPPAKRVESERQRRQRYHGQRERRTDQHASDIDTATMNQVLFGLNEPATTRDERNHNTITDSRSRISDNSNNHNTNTASNANNASLEGSRETRASWLERLRAMREERLAWPVAFVHGLTSRELLQQRRQARELMLSPRLMNVAQDCPLIDPNIDIPASYCHTGQTQAGALQGALSPHLGHNQVPPTSSTRAANASHASQYLSTMSSILSSMEVFAKALELSSARSLSKHSATSAVHMPTMQHHLRVFNTPNEEQNVWQASMRGLLSQMERLMVQLQSIQPITSSAAPTHLHMLQNHLINKANVAVPTNTAHPYHHHHHHHHHYHVDGNLTDRSHMMNPLMDRGLFGEGDARINAANANHMLGLSSRMGVRSDAHANMGHCGLQPSVVPFSMHAHGSGSGGELQQSKLSKSRKRWDVTRMST